MSRYAPFVVAAFAALAGCSPPEEGGAEPFSRAPEPPPAARLSNACNRTQQPAPFSFASTLPGDNVALYLCPTCQGAGGANASDFATKGSIQNAESNPVIELIFWGSTWNSVDTSPSRAQVVSAFQSVVASSYFDGLRQYGVQSVTLDQVKTAADDPPAAYSFSDISSRVFNIIDNTSWFSGRTSNTIFLVIMPKSASPSDSGECGSHGIATEFNYFQINTANVAWAAFSNIDSITTFATHELVEAMTNPHGSDAGLNAWLMDRNFGASGTNEIGDACNNQQDFINGILVQDYWSNTDRACIIPLPRPTVTSVSAAKGIPGSLVTITGTNLGTPIVRGPTVLFGGTPSSNVFCQTTGSCQAVVPNGLGTAQLVVQSDRASITVENFCTALAPNATTCSAIGANCGMVSDYCGGTFPCGVATCPAGQVCGSYYNPNWCSPACTPHDCNGYCGDTTDGCGAPLSCGGCGTGYSCISGVCEGAPPGPGPGGGGSGGGSGGRCLPGDDNCCPKGKTCM